MRVNPSPSTSFHFEAKRLHTDGSLSKYLGDEGLLALVTGHYGNLPHAGMIGYVQSETCTVWGGRIKQAIMDEPADYLAQTPVQFVDLGVSVGEPVFSSEHRYGQPPRQRTITHTLLACA